MPQLKLFVIYLQIGVMILSLITIFSQVLTEAVAAEELIDIEFDDKAIKQELETSETNLNEDDIGKQEEATEMQESNYDTRERESEDNVTINDDDYDDNGNNDNDINPSEEDDVPFELPFNNTLPFP
jgi:hypothetical protein